MRLSLITITFLLSTTLFIGCGSDDEKKENNPKQREEQELNESSTGYIVDSPIEGLNYECGSKKGLTEKNGKFSCDTMPVIFKIGNYTLGAISKMTDDSKIYPQDLLCIDRDNFTNTKLIEMTQFLQALDDDKNIEKSITITQSVRDTFEKIEGYNPIGLCTNGHTNNSNPNPNPNPSPNTKPIKPSQAGDMARRKLKDPVTAMDHLRKAIEPQNYRPADTTDISPYVGLWAGGGWGYEVRFKQKSGEFAQSIADFISEDLDTSRLPFDQEKIIMSLMVTHKTVFKFKVDESGNLTGSGLITYNLLPNLCGLNTLSNTVNATIGNFDKLFSLSSLMGGFAAQKTLKEGITFDGGIAKNLLGSTDTAASFVNKDWRSVLADMAKAEFLDTENSNEICSVVRPNANIAGGYSVGPLSVEDLVAEASINIVKALSSVKASDVNSAIAAAGAIMLSVPGLTQVQYYYKGLSKRPETRNFHLSGHIDKKGKLFLQMDDLVEGSENLPAEYMVNYKTEHFTFPIWSPFLEEGATIYPGNRNFTVYDYVDKKEKKSYTAYSPLGEKSTKTVEVTTPTVTAQTKYSESPTAIFKAMGTNRVPSNSYKWHEYEYSWNAYKIKE